MRAGVFDPRDFPERRRHGKQMRELFRALDRRRRRLSSERNLETKGVMRLSNWRGRS